MSGLGNTIGALGNTAGGTVNGPTSNLGGTVTGGGHVAGWLGGRVGGLGGTVTFGRGTTFVASLPVPSGLPTDARAGGTTALPAGKRVLVVGAKWSRSTWC